MKISELFEGGCPAGLPLDESPIRTERVLDMVRAGVREEKRPRRLHRTLRTALIAAAVAAFMGVTAWAVGVIRIELVERSQTVGFEDSDETQETVEVGFAELEDGPIGPLGVWTVDVPDGYERTNDISIADYANVSWTNSEGGRLGFTYKKAGAGLGDVSIAEEELREKREVTVNGQPGTLYAADAGQVLAWVDQEAGVGFMMRSNDDALDLLALAETVRRTGDKPEPDENALAALQDLGDWTVAALPEGYEEYAVQGSPYAMGGGDYAYVRRYYSDAEGRTIELNYETALNSSYNGYVQYYRDMADMSQEEIDALREMGKEVQGMGCTVTDVTVQGRPAGLVKDADGVAVRLAWLSEDGGTAFILSSDSLTAEELLAAGESVQKAE